MAPVERPPYNYTYQDENMSKMELFIEILSNFIFTDFTKYNNQIIVLQYIVKS